MIGASRPDGLPPRLATRRDRHGPANQENTVQIDRGAGVAAFVPGAVGGLHFGLSIALAFAIWIAARRWWNVLAS
jgi:hypothetical protein